MKRVLFASAFLFVLAACETPQEGPEPKTLTDAELDQVEKTCYQFGRNDERTAKYPSGYCARVSRERAERLVKKK